VYFKVGVVGKGCVSNFRRESPSAKPSFSLWMFIALLAECLREEEPVGSIELHYVAHFAFKGEKNGGNKKTRRQRHYWEAKSTKVR